MTSNRHKTPSMQLLELRYGKPIETLLRELYHDRRMTLEQMSKELGVGMGTLSKWMSRFGIPRREPVWVLPAASDR